MRNAEDYIKGFRAGVVFAQGNDENETTDTEETLEVNPTKRYGRKLKHKKGGKYKTSLNRWTEDEITRLQENHLKMNGPELAKLFPNRTHAAVYYQMYKRGWKLGDKPDTGSNDDGLVKLNQQQYAMGENQQ
jgi:hypothetical protein